MRLIGIDTPKFVPDDFEPHMPCSLGRESANRRVGA
jgi:hypothetical protein